MRILFLTSPEEDYLSDSLLHGFRQLYGSEVVDYPRRDVLYENCPSAVLTQVRGHGFTLYTGLLPDLEIDRFRIRPKLAQGDFDLVVVSDIWRQYGLFLQWRPYFSRYNTIIIDGADSPQVYPYAGWWWRLAYNWTLPRAHREFLYFKREWTPATQFNSWHRLLPRLFWKLLPNPKNIRPVGFAIPGEKIVQAAPRKTKEFSRHIVDPEVAAAVPGSSTSYAFATEQAYYADLQAARFGITMKRAGWDCLRHYEIAANGCVPCFRDLDGKPETCAPHGLVPGVNCISYRDAVGLFASINALNEDGYGRLCRGALEWAHMNTTVQRAQQVLSAWRDSV